MLLDNASKYAPENTVIRVAAARLDARHVTIEVADEGPGIPPPLRERVFEKFYRVPGREPADSNRAGIGLGLPIARRLIEAQGGRMWIQSAGNIAAGTAVMMTLPGAAAAPAAADAAVPKSSPAVTS
jgi:two-component system sensor histidine kinase KdpD